VKRNGTKLLLVNNCLQKRHGKFRGVFLYATKAYKPGSVPFRVAIIYLRQALPHGLRLRAAAQGGNTADNRRA